MLFNSLHFFLFFVAFVPLYFLLPHRPRLGFLLLASCYFYMVLIPKYILILAFLIGLDFSAGILIERAEGRKRKLYLLASLIANLGTLAVFKYYDFFLINVEHALSFLGLPFHGKSLSLILPVGLSFHTFQSLSYTIEVYRGRWKAERDLLTYSLYVMFWPQLVAGPIERPEGLLPQFREPKRFDSDRVFSGLRLMLFGLVKKVVVADGLALYVGTVFDSLNLYAGWPLLWAVYLFSFQILFDFSGYTDMARGAARVLGFDLMINFDEPYLAGSVSEFWKRWHISLSTWFRDYVYIPLGGNRVSDSRHYFNLLTVFALSGLWHGANWTFAIWGLIHGGLLCLSVATTGLRSRIALSLGLGEHSPLLRAFRIALTFHLVAFAWIFFRAPNFSDAWYVVSHLFSPSQPAGTSLPWIRIALAIGICGLPILRERFSGYARDLSTRGWVLEAWRVSCDYGAIALVYWFGVVEQQQFIYFQF